MNFKLLKSQQKMMVKDAEQQMEKSKKKLALRSLIQAKVVEVKELEKN